MLRTFYNACRGEVYAYCTVGNVSTPLSFTRGHSTTVECEQLLSFHQLSCPTASPTAWRACTVSSRARCGPSRRWTNHACHFNHILDWTCCMISSPKDLTSSIFNTSCTPKKTQFKHTYDISTKTAGSVRPLTPLWHQISKPYAVWNYNSVHTALNHKCTKMRIQKL